MASKADWRTAGSEGGGISVFCLGSDGLSGKLSCFDCTEGGLNRASTLAVGVTRLCVEVVAESHMSRDSGQPGCGSGDVANPAEGTGDNDVFIVGGAPKLATDGNVEDPSNCGFGTGILSSNVGAERIPGAL